LLSELRCPVRGVVLPITGHFSEAKRVPEFDQADALEIMLEFFDAEYFEGLTAHLVIFVTSDNARL